MHRLGTATALPAVHLREFLPGPSADWRTRSTPAAQPATRRFGVVNVPTDDRAALLALRQFLLALP